jgi:putative holliday junction resolvase
VITSVVSEFHAALPDGGRLVALDLGTRTIGIALCDRDWSIASPATPIPKSKFAKERAALGAVMDKESAIGIVIGLPLNLDGSDSPRTQSVRAYARNLATLGKPILLWDERWSTLAVERAMIAADMSRAKRAERVDSAAAAYILQGAIDSLRGNLFMTP